MSNSPFYVFEIQASEPGNNGTSYPGYANLTAFVIAPTAERSLELMRAEHPLMRVHQVMRRNQGRNIIVDPDLLSTEDVQ